MDIKLEVTVFNPGCTVKIEAKGLTESVTGYLREDGAVVPEVQIDGVFFQVMETMVKDVIDIISNRELNKTTEVETTINKKFTPNLD